MNFASYIVLSTLVVFGIVAHAYVAHEQFYPAVVYLSTDKMCLAVMYNFAFALFLLFGKVLLRIFIGTLRDLEVEQLVDSGRGFLADTILFLVFYAPTIDNKDVDTVYLIQYVCAVIFMKVFHLTTQIRVSHMFEVGVPRLIVNIKLVALMCLLLGGDLFALQYFYGVASRSSTFFTWILFEALTMSTVVMVSICKYTIHMIDLRLENGWPGKSVCLFYIDLIHDVVSMTLFLVFMLTFFVQNPSRLPIYMMADVVQVARKLAQRLRSFRRYRRISLNMEARFPDATDAEIEQNEHCVICRDSLFEGSKPKKLPCGHIFHIDCLRSWFVMQQVCPTCRAEVPADGPSVPQAPPDARRDAQPAPADVPPAPEVGPGAGTQAAAAATVGAPPLEAQGKGASSAAPLGTSASTSSTQAAPAAPSNAPSPPVRTDAVPSKAPQRPSPAPTVPQGSPDVFESTRTASCTAEVPPGAQAAIYASGMLGAAPPVNEILDALKRAEEMATFLRQQTQFWKDQVESIRENAPQLHAFAGGAAGLSSGHFAALAAGPGRVGGMSNVGTSNSSAAPATVPESAVGGPSPATQESISEAQPSVSPQNSSDQMAELRRLQKEQWERRRSSSFTEDAN